MTAAIWETFSHGRFHKRAKYVWPSLRHMTGWFTRRHTSQKRMSRLLMNTRLHPASGDSADAAAGGWEPTPDGDAHTADNKSRLNRKGYNSRLSTFKPPHVYSNTQNNVAMGQKLLKKIILYVFELVYQVNPDSRPCQVEARCRPTSTHLAKRT